jgi:hypothetical protein
MVARYVRGPPLAFGGREGRILRFHLFSDHHNSPFHIPTDIVVVSISHASFGAAECTKLKCTFDLENDRVQVFRHTVGPWAAQSELTWSNSTFSGSQGA